MTNQTENIVIQYSPLVKESENSYRLQRRHEEADIYDIEVLKYNQDGTIETLESHSDVTAGRESALVFETLKGKYPNATEDILGD